MMSPLNVQPLNTNTQIPANTRLVINSVMISVCVCLVIDLLFMLTSDQFVHWFLLPITICGVIMASDMIDWLRGRMDIMDPAGLLGLLGVHFFFLAPLLMVLWNYQMAFLETMTDWRPWLGSMGLLNIVGLMFYRISRGWIKIHPVTPRLTARIINTRLLTILLYFGLGITAALQVMAYSQFGGVTQFIALDYERISATRGSGVLFVFSESFPFLLMIAIAVYMRARQDRRTWFLIISSLLLFFVLRIYFGGLRGSRSNTLFAMIWAVGVVHLWIRPITWRFLAVGMVGAAIFIYVMGFYKSLGSDFGRVFENPTQLQALAEETGRSDRVVIISDLSRADVQAYILRNLTERWPDFPYAWGRTYLSGYTIIVPSALWPSKPESKVMEGTQALLGPGRYIPGVNASSRVYGLMGEAMLNFGPILAPLSFITLGLLVGIVRRWYYTLHSDDAFRLLLPFLIILCVMYIGSDSDNNATALMFRGFVPLLVIWFGSSRQSVQAYIKR